MRKTMTMMIGMIKPTRIIHNPFCPACLPECTFEAISFSELSLLGISWLCLFSGRGVVCVACPCVPAPFFFTLVLCQVVRVVKHVAIFVSLNFETIFQFNLTVDCNFNKALAIYLCHFAKLRIEAGHWPGFTKIGTAPSLVPHLWLVLRIILSLGK